jgi:hypothetical protein
LLSQPVLVSLIHVVFITKQLYPETNQLNPKIISDSSKSYPAYANSSHQDTSRKTSPT